VALSPYASPSDHGSPPGGVCVPIVADDDNAVASRYKHDILPILMRISVASATAFLFRWCQRSSQMRIILVVAAALILICVGAGAATITPHVAATMTDAVNPFQLTTNAL
jgi:heme A synthase